VIRSAIIVMLDELCIIVIIEKNDVAFNKAKPNAKKASS